MLETLEKPMDVSNSNQKEYWETGIDAHIWKGIESVKAERYRQIANKVHYLVEQNVIDKYKSEDQGGNDKELEIYGILSSTGEQGFKNNCREINSYINYLDQLQFLIDKKKIDLSPYKKIEGDGGLIDDLKKMGSKNEISEKEREEINNKLIELSSISASENYLS